MDLLREARTLRPRYTAAQIRRMVRAIALEVDRAYEGSEPVLVGVLKGSVFFLADLARALTVPVAIDFVRLSSYRGGVSPGARIRLTKDVETDVSGRDVLVVEEIVDTGRSVRFLRRHFERKRARSVRFCALVDKRARREEGITVEYTGFRAGGGFLVGYGMDHAESGRGLPDIFDLPGTP
ncbi:MAG: hypoxanthine phosphoribosyltransferase [Deltaproteobacteria bacterium]|nr:MAG: hypoxanthine phosphoribosyltransferase [Deltaproteobacteria bacterium]